MKVVQSNYVSLNKLSYESLIILFDNAIIFDERETKANKRIPPRLKMDIYSSLESAMEKLVQKKFW